MSDKISDLLISTLKDIKDDLRHIDERTNEMHGILTKNTVVLEEHERRSTLSERRIHLLEEKAQKRAEDVAKFKGFFIYAGLIVSALTSIGAFFHYVVQPLLGK